MTESSTEPPLPAIQVTDLSVHYGRFCALNRVTVNFPSGCVGLLGPNGSGKTTLIKTLLGFVDPSSGGASVLGSDIRTQGRRLRQLSGLMPEQDCHLPGMSAVEFVAYVGRLAGMPDSQALRRAHEVLEYCGLGEARYRKVETYSTGMKQRIKLAQALVNGPKILFLDEPTNGLDPRGREDMLELIRNITQSGKLNVVISSHLLKDIERTCTHVVVIAGGQLRTTGLVKDLLSVDGQPFDVELRESSFGFIAELEKLGGRLVEQRGHHYRVIPPGNADGAAAAFFQAAQNSGAEVRGFEVARKTLEEAFLEAIH